MPSADADVVESGERFEAIGEDVAAGRSAISANLDWSPDADASAAGPHHAAAAKENGE